LIVLILITLLQCSFAMIDSLYCGRENCYDVLGVTRDTPKNEISKAYRQLAKIHHPDRHQGQEAKHEAAEKFKAIATAYEVLKDEDMRNDYDYMLDNPEDYYRNYYHYYRRRITPKVDVRLVIAVTITVISIFQYYTAQFRWSSGMRYLATQPKYRAMALQVAEEEGMLNALKKIKKRNKEEIKQEEERIIKQILEEKMDIRGGYAKPKVTDVLWLQIIFFPYGLYLYIRWYIRWMWRFSINKEEYGTEEKLYLIRKFMGLSETQFEIINETEHSEFLKKELWIKDNFVEWKAAQDEERKRQLAESARFKSYRRYMKKHGPGRMYFDDG